jgi:hypothetical protein
LLHVPRAGKIFYCPIKSNRKDDDSDAKAPYRAAVSDLEWSVQYETEGKLIKVFSKGN